MMEEAKKRKEKWWLPDQEQFKGTWREDWRIMGQEGYLLNKQLQYRKFSRAICFEDFTQCEFCWDTFDDDPENPKNAYYEPISRVWICEKCYRDFLEHFHWTVIENC
jgi:Fe-S-cluster formation regulator IscX/YfhJ